MSGGLVWVIDDDDAVRGAIGMLLRSVGLDVRDFESAAEFLEVYDPMQPSCVLLDVRMPGMSGIEAQRRLAELRPDPVIIFLSGHADVPVAVEAMKSGAVDFIQKPFNDQALIDCIHRALDIAHTRIRDALSKLSRDERIASLTPRERQVLERICDGKANKVIAADLDLSERTVEIHRANVMRKMEAGSVAELVRLIVS